MPLDWTARCDALIAGTGLAGLRAAYDCAKAGLEVILISKGGLCSGASFYPLADGLGSQLPDGEADKPVYLAELMEAGAGVGDEELCLLLVDQIWPETRRLPEIGIDYGFYSGRAACFARRERALTVWSDWPKVRRNCERIFSGFANLRLLPFCDLLRLDKRDGAIAGAIVCDRDNRIGYVAAPAVILATGGYCGLYGHSLNTPDVCGIGHSVALDAGADAVNLEFLQFIPGLTAPKYGLLFSETTLLHCSAVIDERGEAALEPYLPEGVTLRQCLTARSAHGPFTTADASRYFDLAIMEHVRKTGSQRGLALLYGREFDADPNPCVRMARDFYRANGIDLPAQPISVLPFAHCANGGIRIDRDGATAVPGLYAAGEAAGGVHGADRHGGAATASCLVFGARAARAVIRAGAGAAPADGERALLKMLDWMDGEARTDPREVLDFLGREMWHQAGVLRDGARLEKLLGEIRGLRKSYGAASAIRAGVGVKTACKAFHALRTCEAAVRAMSLRCESRGGHCRVDFPGRDDRLSERRVHVSEAGGELAAHWRDMRTLPNDRSE